MNPRSAAVTDAPALRVTGASKRFGTTQAVDDVSLRVGVGELVGIAGHNGAGKSTLLNIVAGRVRADAGTVELPGTRRAAASGPGAAGGSGVRMVYQELSLCPTLRVDDTAAVFDHTVGGASWRREAWRRLAAVLDEMFPQHGIRPGVLVRELSLSRRQMIECACAMLPGAWPAVLVVLDEPTSSLDTEATASFYAYLRKRAEQGLAAMVTTHRLHEMVENLDRIYVMRDGRVITEQTGAEVTKESLVRAMGVGAHQQQPSEAADTGAALPPAASPESPPASHPPGTGQVRVEITEPDPDGTSLSIEVRAGEIVGLAGLEGHGQLELLDALSRASARFGSGRRRTRFQQVEVNGTMANVSGDRGVRGIFRHWSVAANVSVSSLPGIATAGFVSRCEESRLVRGWWDRLGMKGRPSDPIVSLSGGTQQKALMARALTIDADVLLLDDPTRGVDQATKDDIYQLLREQAQAGKCVIWYSTENEELRHCDRVLVLRGGRIVGTLLGSSASEDMVIATSFAGSS